MANGKNQYKTYLGAHLVRIRTIFVKYKMVHVKPRWHDVYKKKREIQS